MNILQSLLVYFVEPILGLIIFAMFIYMAFSWLIAFNIINLRNPVMAQIYSITERIVEPILTPIRKLIPPMGGLDLAFLVAIMGLYWVKGFVVPSLYNLFG